MNSKKVISAVLLVSDGPVEHEYFEKLLTINNSELINLIHEINYITTDSSNNRIFRTKGTILHNRYFNIGSEFYLYDKIDFLSNINLNDIQRHLSYSWKYTGNKDSESCSRRH
mgnify:CR=1 FL=1